MRNTILGWTTALAKLGHIHRKSSKNHHQRGFTRRLRMESLEHRHLLTITVDNAFDELDADRSVGDTSLREAIFDADPAGEMINFAPTINSLNLSLDEIAFSKSLTIDGGTAGVTIHAAANNRIFDISAGSVDLNKLTLTGGDLDAVSGNGGAIRKHKRVRTIYQTVPPPLPLSDDEGLEIRYK